MSMIAPAPSPVAVPAGRLVAAGGQALPLRHTRLRAEACAGLARVVVEQHFRNPWPEPLAVSYALPLPHDGVVSGFAFSLGERRVDGEIERVELARARFEHALLEGRCAGLLEQTRASLFTQALGNVPPGADIIAEITIDQPLAWITEGAWEWRFPTTVAPRYSGSPDRVEDAAQLAQDVALPGGGPRLALQLTLRDTLSGDARPHSPTHTVRATRDGEIWQVALHEDDDAALDRDLVLRWPVAAATPGLALDVARPPPGHAGARHAYALLSVVPPRPQHAPAPIARDLVLLIDSSGSMSGEPLEQAKRLAGALIDSLQAHDTLEMIEFSSRPRRWQEAPCGADAASRADALAWLAALQAGGATEMVSGVVAALAVRRERAQRQVVLISDGLIGFEHEVVRRIRDALPEGSRLHCAGIGPAPNRSLTSPCARAGRGVEVIVGLDEPVDRAAQQLLARLAAPLVTGLSMAGDAVVQRAPRALPDLHAGAPVRIALELAPEGGEVCVCGTTASGEWRASIQVPPSAPGTGCAALAALYAREAVEDLELDLAAGAERECIDAAIERMGLDFSIATRLTAWVAIAHEQDVDPTLPIRRVRQPQQLPRGLSAEGLGLAPMASMTVHDASLLVAYSMSEDRPRLALRGAASYSVHSEMDEYEDLCRPSKDEAGPRLGALHDGAGQTPHARAARKRRRRPRLSARIAHRIGVRGLLVFEITVHGGEAMQWRLPDEVELSSPHGARVAARLAHAMCTADGQVAGGTSIRLALIVDAHARLDPPDAIHLRSLLYGWRRVPVVP